MVERWSTRAEELYVEAVVLSDEERAVYLDEQCSDDAELREEVESLLTAHESTPSMIDRPVAASVLASMKLENEASWVGRTIGPYRLQAHLGTGGMGTVYLAEQQRPIRRQVALKVMHSTSINEQMIRRFSSERQALALMSHPNIARVFDAGSGEGGELYVVMEPVPGEPLNHFCDDRRLSVRQRLELFISVCEGVHHAHQKGVIHRDLKPSNVLVMEEQGEATPKIIDFGIAKAVDEPLIEATLVTGERLVGTPAYMSPERFRGGGDVDTRADVYSLGVMLYELLVGELPYRFEGEGIVEIASELETVEVLRPSARLTTLEADQLAALAEERSTDTATLNKRLRGDLDWITLCALEKDRERRYGSVAELAEDIRRHLRHEPVAAGPPSASYRVRKFVRRHKVAVVATVLVAASMVAGTVVSTWQASAARAARDEAEQAQHEAEQQQALAKQVSGFLVELFKVSDPGEARGNSITAREILDRGGDRISTELEDEPEVQATLMLTISSVYENLGLYDRAQELAEQGVRIRRRVFGERHPEVASSLSILATVLRSRGEYAEAERLHREELSIRREALGADHPEVLDSLNNVGLVLIDLGEFEEAERILSEVVTTRRATGAGDADMLETSISNLALLLQSTGDYDAAEELQREALEMIISIRGEDHPGTTIAINNLATTLTASGKFEEAEKLQRDALALRRRLLGDDHPDVATCLNNLASLLMQTGRYEEAERPQREALAIQQAAFGDDHPHVANSLANLAILALRMGDHQEAATLGRQALETARRAFDGFHPLVGRCLLNLGSAVEELGDFEEAEALYREAVVVFRESRGTDRLHVAAALNNIGVLMFRQERYEEAETAQRDALTIIRQAVGAGHPYTAIGLYNLAWTMQELDRFAEAEQAFRESLTIRRRAFSADHLSVSESLVGLGSTLIEQGDGTAAESLVREALEIRRGVLEEGDWRIAEATSVLGASVADQGRYEEAEALLLEGFATLKSQVDERPSEARKAAERLVALYEAWHRRDRAEHFRRVVARFEQRENLSTADADR